MSPYLCFLTAYRCCYPILRHQSALSVAERPSHTCKTTLRTTLLACCAARPQIEVLPAEPFLERYDAGRNRTSGKFPIAVHTTLLIRALDASYFPHGKIYLRSGFANPVIHRTLVFGSGCCRSTKASTMSSRLTDA